MALSPRKKEKLARERRIQNVKDASYSGNGLTFDANWDEEVRRYIETGEVGEFLASKFASKGIAP